MFRKLLISCDKFTKVHPISSVSISTSIRNSFAEDFNHILKSLGSKFNMDQVDRMLAASEEHVDVRALVPRCPVTQVHINSLAANSKLEDRWNVGVNQLDGQVSSMLVAVVDGHSGKDCAQLVNRAALEYIAAASLDTSKLERSLTEYKEIPHYTLVRRFHPGQWESLNDSVKSHFIKSLFTFMTEMLSESDRIVDPSVAMKTALSRLDTDMCVPPDRDSLKKWFHSRPLLRLSLSGAVGLFMRLYWLGNEGEPNPTIHLANVGDCGAVLGSIDRKTKKSVAKMLNVYHNFSNENEKNRLMKEHPQDDPAELFRDCRLLGELMPSRSFGDVRYKWPKDWLFELDAHIKLPGNLSKCPTPYTSPPYLTAEPDVFRYVLDPSTDKFIILATDGLWDTLTPEQAVDVVFNCPQNQSPATHLIKHSLSGYSANNDIDVHKLSMHLALTPGIARYFRDDITVMVFKL